MADKHGTNIIVSDFVGEQKFYLLSDLHWDNPKSDWRYLKSVLDKAKGEGAKVGINGDMFCLMQGKYDGRRVKGDIRPEHNTATYMDSVISTAAEWFAPYADIIEFVGYGNHETAIIKHLETDPIERFITQLNYSTGERVHKGGYNGWWILRSRISESSNTTYTHRIHHLHGWGGGGPVTKGMIKFNRIATKTSNYDALWVGHIHDLMIDYHNVQEVAHHPSTGYQIKQKTVAHIVTPSFKNEFVDGGMGFQNERNNANKPLGYVELTVTPLRREVIVSYQLVHK